jgi:hypothetical protein
MASSSEIKNKWSKVHTTAKNVPVYAGAEKSRELSEDEEIERRWQSNDSTARVDNSAVVNESMARTAAVNRLRAQQRQEMSRALGGSGEDSGNFRKGLQSGAAQRQLADTAQTLREQPYHNRLSITGSVAGDAQALRFGRTGILDLPRQKSTPQTAREAAVQRMIGSGTDGWAARKDGGKAAKGQQGKKDGALAYLAKSAGTGAVSGFANVGSNLIDNDQSVRELIARVHDAADGEDAQKLAQKQNEAYWKNKVRPASEGGKNGWDSLTAGEQEKLRNAGPYSTVGMKRANSERDVISADETMRGALGIEQGGRLAGMYQQEQGKTGGLRVAGDVVSAVGGMAPNMAASAVGGPAAGFTALYASAAGASAQEARDNGADTLTAGLAGALSGGVEIATEKMFDGVPGLRGEQYASISNAVDGAVNRIFKTATGRRLANRAVNMAGEGLEEYVSDVAGSYISQLYQEDDRSFAQRLADPDAWYSFLIGSLMSAAMSGPVDAVNDSLAQRTGKSVQAQQMTDAVLEIAEQQGGEAAELAGTMRQQQAAGKKFTPTDLGYLFNALDENGRAEIMDRVVNQDTISENGQAAEGLPSSAAAAAPSPEGEGLGELPSSPAGDISPAAAEEARNLSGEENIQKQAAEMARAALAEQEARRQEQAFTQPLIRQVQQETAEMAGGETVQGQQREAGLASAAAEKPSTTGEGSEALRRIAAQRNMVAGGMTVDEAEQAYNARQAAQKNVGEVQKIAESGIYNDAMNAALVENYRGGSVDTYVQAMSGLYNAGRTGSLTFEQGVRAVAPAAAVVNNETALRAAYEAGRSTVTAAEPMAAPGVSGNPSITMRGTTPESTSTPLQALQLAAMKLGTNVTIAGELDDGNGNAVNGSYNAANNEISLSEKSVNSYQTALHETAHYIQQNNPEGWAALKQTALAFYTEKVGMTEAQDKVFKTYENAYGTDTGLYDEVAADLLSGIMSTDDGVEQYCDYILTADQYTTPQKRTILQTLRDAIGQLIESIKNVLRGGDATLGAAEGRKLAERAENLQEAAGIVDEYLDALDAAKNNAHETGKQKNVQVEQKGEQKNKYSYVGVQGQNVDRDALREARIMEKNGEDAEDIRKATGWFRGADRMWRYEVDNSTDEFNRKGDNLKAENPDYAEYKNLWSKVQDMTITDGEWKRLQELTKVVKPKNAADGGKLSEYLKAPGLYEQYPQLKDITLRFEEMEEGLRGYYNHGKNDIVLNKNFLGEYASDKAKSTLLHEVQHWIQNYEGFASGASTEYWQNMLAGGNEIVTRDMQEQTRNLQSLRNRYPGIDRLARHAEKYVTEHNVEAYEDVYRQAAEAGINEGVLDYYRGLRDFVMNPMKESRAPFELYRDTAGEIEARDVQKRMNYTAEQRRAEKPDTGNGDTVFAVNGDSFSKNNVKFSMDVPVEETKDLVAVHNVDERALERSLELGGLPMPSIAVIKAEQGHSKYGPISLVFGKDTIDPQRNSENKVYGGDGYTPTAPQIDYKVDTEKARQVERKIQLLSDKVAGGIFSRGSLLRAHNVEGTTDMDTRTLAALLSNDDTARAAYLADQGKTLEPVKMEKVWSRYGNETVQKVIDKVGVQKLAETEVAFQTTGVVPDGVEDAVRSVLRDHYRKTTDGMLQRQAARKGWDADTIAQKREERINRSMENNVTWFTIHDLIDSAWNMYQDGGKTQGEVDRMATSDKLRETVNDADVEKWLEGQLDGVLGEKGIYNGKERYKANGDRKSFESLHYPVTLENIVRVMKQSPERGGDMWGVTPAGLQSVSTPEYSSIAELKQDSGRLGSEESESYKAKIESVDGQISDAISRIRKETKAHADNEFEECDIISNVMLQAAGKKTAAAIRRTFAGEGYDISPETAKRLQTLYRDAAQLPTEYFEAKPRRAVGFDEVKAAILPDNVSDSVRGQLEKLGVPVIEYAANDEDARLRALNSVENVKFSKKKQTAAEQIVGEATEKEQLKKQLTAAETEKRELARKYTKARESADYWRQETQLSGGHLMEKKAVQKTASEFIDKYGSRYGKSQLAGELERAFSKISRDGVSTEEALETLTNIARGVLKESTVKDTTLRDYYAPVRDWLKNTTFEIRKNSPEYGDLMSEYGDGADGTHSWANVRKNTFGRVNLKLVGEDVTGNLDTAMMEMADNWPTIFDAEAAPVDNIRNALGVYEASQVQYHDAYGNDLDTAAALAGQELMDAYLETPTRETRADKAAAQLNQTRTALRAEQKAALAAQKAAYEVRVKALESDQSAQKAKLRAKWIETTRKAAQANNTKVAERLNRQAEGYKAQLMRMDTPDYKKMQKQLLNQRAAFETLNERRKDTILLDRARDSVQKNVKQLYKWLAKPNEAGRVQTKMEKAVYDLLGKIDPSTSARGTKSDIRWQETMKDIRQMAQQSLDADKGLNDADDYADFDPDLPNMISELIDDVGDIDLHKLNGRQTQQLADILTSMKTSILNANKMMADGRGKAVQTVAEGSILDMQSVKASQLKNRNALLGKAADTRVGDMTAQLLGLDMMDARRYFSSLGSVAENDVYKPIRDGFDKRVWKLDAAQEKFAEIKGDADISKWTGDKAERQTFKLADGNEIALTVGQRMEIYNLTQRQQAHEHLVKGGISIMEDGKKKKRVRLTPGDLADITSSLTNEQVKMARKMAAYLSATDGPAGWGNEVTQKLYGLNKFTESYYWPIKTDSNYTRTSDATAGDTPGLYAIKNQGFTKALQRKANNPLIINDAFDTWCDHVANMATYNAWAIPLSDAMKWYNYHGENEISTKEAIDGVYGANGKKFFQTLMQDINGVSAAPSQTGYGRLTKTMVRNWKVAKVGANLRVAIQQPTAYTRAAAVISPKYLTAALAYDVGRLKQGMERAESNCGIAKWKSWGYFETNIGQTMKSVLTGERDTLDKVREISTMGAEWGDKITWGTLWNACELEARDKGMKPGSQESIDYCAARLSEIVDKTQVVDSVLHRSQIMRSKDMLTQMATNFFAEPTKTYSMIAEAAVKVAHREEGARANMGRVMATYFVTAFGTAAAAGLIDAMRAGSDDKDKEFGERYLDALWDGFVDNINLLNNIPMVKDVISIFDGYDATRTDMEAATDMYNAVVAWQKFLTQNPNSNVTPYKLLYKTANAIADVTGIPVGTAVREVKSAYDIVTALQDPLHVDETFTDTNAKLNSRLMRGQMDEAQDMLNKLVQNKIDGGKTAKEARSSIRSSLTSKWKPLYLAAEDAQRAEIASKLLALRVNGEALYTQKDLSKWVEDSKKKEKK